MTQLVVDTYSLRIWNCCVMIPLQNLQNMKRIGIIMARGIVEEGQKKKSTKICLSNSGQIPFGIKHFSLL
jgi:hypothetical protein